MHYHPYEYYWYKDQDGTCHGLDIHHASPLQQQAQPQKNSRHVILFSTGIMVQLTLDEIGTFITSNRSQSWLVGTECLPGAFFVRSIFLP